MDICSKCNLAIDMDREQPGCDCCHCRCISVDRPDLTPEKILALQEDTNPKDVAARNRVAMCLLPSAGKIHGAHAMMDGARKYGPYNWRQKKVQLMVYAHAIERHLESYIDGQDVAPDSLAHHLGHIIADCSIVLDAMECGVLVDDRPEKGKAADILERLGK